MARDRFEDFLNAIHNLHTRRAYDTAVNSFLAHCEAAGVRKFAAIRQTHVTNWIEQRARARKPATVRANIAAVRCFFDWLIREGTVSANPVGATRCLPPKLRTRLNDDRRKRATP